MQGSNEGTRQQGPEETLSQLSQQKARESEQVIELQKRCDNLLSERVSSQHVVNLAH